MADRAVEKTLVVRVPVARAWTAFTDPAERSKWEAPDYEIDARPGGKTRWKLPGFAPVDGEVVEVVSEQRLVQTEGAGILDGATEITVTFEAVANGTRITVTQSGFGEGPRWDDSYEGHSLGWEQGFRDLAAYLEHGVAPRRFFHTFKAMPAFWSTQTFAGLVVTGVEPEGFAASAGLQPGDLVLYFDERLVYTRAELWTVLRERAVGDEVAIEVARGGALTRLSGVLGS